MLKVMKKGLTGLMLAAMLTAAGGAEATAFTTTGTAAPTCAGAITVAANGVVTCAAGGTKLLSSCTGNIVIDSEGVARCSAAAVAPACTLTQANFQGAIALTANCTPAATSYTWSSNTGFASTQSSGLVSPTVNTTYTVRGTNAAGAGNTASLTVTVGATTGQPACTLSASPSSISAGGTVTLTASCSPAATSYTWTGTGCAGNANTCTAAPANTTTYTVAGINTAGTGNPASATVTVTTASAPPACTLTQSFFAGQTRLTANCTPAANSYTWSANTGFASTDSGGFVAAPTVTTTYTVRGTNAAGSGNTATLTITVLTPKPACTLMANPTAIDQGGTSTLTASCSPAATSHTWTGAGCTAVTVNTCTVTLTAAGVTTYTVAGTNADGTGNPASATVTVAKPSCTPTAAPSSVAPNGSSILTANCSPSVGTTYFWTGGACQGGTTASTCVTGALANTTIYTVTGTNTLGSNAASVTVTVAKPTCTLTASPASIGRGESSTLTASCSPAADSYSWTGTGCTAVTVNTCTVTPAAGATTYTVAGINLAGTGNPASATVTAAAPSCTLTASPSTVSPNGASTLTASCNPVAASYAWSGGICAGKTTSTCSVTPAATTTYSVTGSDPVGPGNTANATVTVASDPGCPSGYTYTVVPITWAPQISIKGPLHTMNHCEVKAFQFTMPARSSPMQSQTSYGTVPKYLSMSQTAFDFSPSLEASGCAAAGQNNPIVWNSTGAPMSGVCPTVAGATYYLNVRNAASREGPDNCLAGSACTFYLAW